MSERIGKELTCDRCGKSVFLLCTGTSELVGGFNRVINFEKRPDGWEDIIDLGLLCPNCKLTYKNLVDSFMESSRKENKNAET